MVYSPHVCTRVAEFELKVAMSSTACLIKYLDVSERKWVLLWPSALTHRVAFAR